MSAKPQKGAAGAFAALAGTVTTHPQAKRTTARKASKVKPEVASFVPRILDATRAAFVLLQDKRPTQGREMFAHTHAALSALGMMSDKRPGVPRSSIATMLGQRAIEHHTKEGNFEALKADRIRLTSAGLKKFAKRVQSPTFMHTLAADYQTMFHDGKPPKGVSARDVFSVAISL